ncbi:hypothetical protein CEXT_111081 [Caerostris extrusa]|uniref:Uncharacterized protein n=1 Tax=Caerostris extrusa TaxID=172846 RepID=A0AAV4MVF2_CAEEX|nr:hypothetical protein CEXT_111081 [Caerostris extrusa]
MRGMVIRSVRSYIVNSKEVILKPPAEEEAPFELKTGPLNSVRYTELPEQCYVRIRTEFLLNLSIPRTPRSQRTHNERDNGSAKTLGLVKTEE